MLKRDKKNICHTMAGIKFLLLLLLLLPAIVQAQSDSNILADSLPPEITEAPAEEPPTVEVSTVDNERNDFFLKKWDSPADSSVVQRH